MSENKNNQVRLYVAGADSLRLWLAPVKYTAELFKSQPKITKTEKPKVRLFLEKRGS